MPTKNQVHSTSLNSYNANHTLYDKLRPEFDSEFVEKFFKSLSLAKGQRILELAAGTGKFTKELVNHGYADELIIVEPSEGMLESFQKNFPSLDSRIGSSYEIPLNDSSVDCVIVAQGFHWFSDKESLKEIYRVLKPRGKIGLIWNFDSKKNNYNDTRLSIEDQDLKDMVAWEQIANEVQFYDSEVPQYRKAEWRKVFDKQELFDVKTIDSQFQYKMHPFPKDSIYDYWLTRSFITSLPDEEKMKLKAKVEIAIEHSPGNCFVSENEIKQFMGSHFFVIDKV